MYLNIKNEDLIFRKGDVSNREPMLKICGHYECQLCLHHHTSFDSCVHCKHNIRKNNNGYIKIGYYSLLKIKVK